MIVVMKMSASAAQLDAAKAKAEELGFMPHVIEGKERNVIGLVGINGQRDNVGVLADMPGVDGIVPISKPYKLASSEVKSGTSIVMCGDVPIGGEEIIVMAGPCSVEDEIQIVKSAEYAKAAGAKILRGGAYKPRTSPYSFQGLGETGLKYMAKAREVTGLPIVSEVVNPRDVDTVYKYVDMFQVGARNIQNFALLSMLGQLDKPVLLKRGMATTIDEYLQCAEYILSEGNHNVVLCERGIRTFETSTRNTLDISCVPVIKEKSHLPIMIDPSHSGGHRQYVNALSRAAVAVGADGVIVEMHPDPDKALSDAAQTISPEHLIGLMGELKAVALAVGRYM